MEKSQNPIAARSRRMLREALLELMREKSYGEITVTALCDRAQLGRKTFYRNYTEKDEVLREYLDELSGGFVAALRACAPFGDEVFARTMFSYWKPYAALFETLARCGQFRFVMREFDRVVGQIGDFFRCPEEERCDPLFQRYCGSYVSGGCHALLRDWMCGGAVESVEQMTALFCRIRRLEA